MNSCDRTMKLILDFYAYNHSSPQHPFFCCFMQLSLAPFNTLRCLCSPCSAIDSLKASRRNFKMWYKILLGSRALCATKISVVAPSLLKYVFRCSRDLFIVFPSFLPKSDAYQDKAWPRKSDTSWSSVQFNSSAAQPISQRSVQHTLHSMRFHSRRLARVALLINQSNSYGALPRTPPLMLTSFRPVTFRTLLDRQTDRQVLCVKEIACS